MDDKQKIYYFISLSGMSGGTYSDLAEVERMRNDKRFVEVSEAKFDRIMIWASYEAERRVYNSLDLE